jgi:Catalytic LigB subunit of aromatic ring-opening dioxygenase
MAHIALGLATSHGPMLSVPPEAWTERVPADRANPKHFYQGKTYTFDQMAEMHKASGLAALLTPAVFRERHARCQKAICQLGDIFEKARPDAAIIVGNDQMEIFTNDHVPSLAIFWGDYVEGIPRTPEFLASLPPGVARAELDRTPAEYTQYPGIPALGKHLIEHVTAWNFDVAQLTHLPTGAIGSNAAPHAYGFVYRRLLRDRLIPHVPVFVNTFYPPNQPSAARCHAFGQALARAIAAYPDTNNDLKIAVIASGGMTHFVIDEAFDKKVLDAMLTGDAETLANLPESMFQSGTSEIKNWITVAGMMAESGLKMELIDYVPCYRSEAGTGSAMGFAHWQ